MSRFPEWTALIRKLDTLPYSDYRQCCVLFTHRAKESLADLDAKCILKKQTVVNARHRSILCEWLTEVGDENHFPAISWNAKIHSLSDAPIAQLFLQCRFRLRGTFPTPSSTQL